MTNILMGYHESCTDGITAATIAHTKFGEQAEYVPFQYNRNYPDSLFKDKDVYLLDFSFKRERMLEIIELANSVTVIDHHRTAKTELDEIPNRLFDLVFDLEKSGAALTWKFFYPGVPTPLFVRLVSEYDLWQHKDERTVHLHKYLMTTKFDVVGWVSKLFWTEDTINEVCLGGMAISNFTDVQTSNLAEKAGVCWINGVQGLAINASSCFTSELGNKLAVKQGGFGAVYQIIETGDVIVSLRSVGDTDVSELATIYGGGGHKNAAAFKLPLNRLKFVGQQPTQFADGTVYLLKERAKNKVSAATTIKEDWIESFLNELDIMISGKKFNSDYPTNQKQLVYSLTNSKGNSLTKLELIELGERIHRLISGETIFRWNEVIGLGGIITKKEVGILEELLVCFSVEKSLMAIPQHKVTWLKLQLRLSNPSG